MLNLAERCINSLTYFLTRLPVYEHDAIVEGHVTAQNVLDEIEAFVVVLEKETDDHYLKVVRGSLVEELTEGRMLHTYEVGHYLETMKELLTLMTTSDKVYKMIEDAVREVVEHGINDR